MTTFAITNRPSGTATRVIGDIIQNFDDILTALNNKGVDSSNLADYAVTAIKMGTLPQVAASISAPPSVANTTYYSVPYNLESYDTDGMHNTAVNPERFTCVTPGLYLVNVTGHFLSTAAAIGNSQLWKGGSQVYNKVTYTSASGNTLDLNFTQLIRLGVGEYLSHVVYHTNGSSLTAYNLTFQALFLSK